ncbi:7885_t:CDS:2 [Paraglomus brasilianum]|uniref:7885_t:CDS:1 n=1 Tax=Paraglomus brasilianum TaxID=144538 RepID=A0A9N9GUW5_9GLOM|nr:7885_t:CDS:2 [Paraglomus brasilianum]
MLSRIGLSNKLAPRFLSPVRRLSSTTQEKDMSEYEKTKPYNSTEQTNTSTTNEVASTDTAYNGKNVDPHEELKQAKEETKKDILDRSAADEQVSQTTDNRSQQPVG